MSDFFSSSASFTHDDDDEPDYVQEPWEGPPENVLGAIVPIERFATYNAYTVIALTHASVFATGVQLHLQISARRGDMDEDRWWELEQAFWGHTRPPRRGKELPDSLRRFGVRFADGRKATVLGDDIGAGPPESEPAPPVLVSAGGSGGSGSDTTLESAEDLWLWPLPPAEPFEFVVEWPLAGIELTTVDLDGAAFRTAADRAKPFWPAAANS